MRGVLLAGPDHGGFVAPPHLHRDDAAAQHAEAWEELQAVRFGEELTDLGALRDRLVRLVGVEPLQPHGYPRSHARARAWGPRARGGRR